jgi:hypothetical protein
MTGGNIIIDKNIYQYMATCQAICLEDKKLYDIIIHILNMGETKPMFVKQC